VSEDLAAALVLARKEQGMSQRDLARRVGTGQSAVSVWESGKDINVSTLARWADALGYRIELALLSRSDTDKEAGQP
jgi:transcriptional regulator with XRE-family HTH domain